MKTFLFLILFNLVSVSTFAGNPHDFETVLTILNSSKVKDIFVENSNYFFQSVRFEESDNGWTDHVFTLLLEKHSGIGPNTICFELAFDEQDIKSEVRVRKSQCLIQ
jgi:hypothetical protein